MWFDPATVEAVRDAFPEWTAFLFAFFSYLGSVWFVAPAVVIAYWFGNRYRFAPWLAITMGGYAIMVGLKGSFSVDRPGVGPAIAPDSLPLALEYAYAPAVEVGTTSFPSGHAIAGTIIWTMIALETDIWTRRHRLLAGAAMIVAVAFSRIAVGLHYPIDVLVGIAIALSYLLVVLTVLERVTGSDPRRRASVAFAITAVLGGAAFFGGGRIDGAVISAGAVGGLVAWNRTAPPATPWPRTVSGGTRAVLGLCALSVVGLVLTVSNALAVWVVVGLVSGVLFIGLPSVFSSVSTQQSVRDATG